MKNGGLQPGGLITVNPEYQKRVWLEQLGLTWLIYTLGMLVRRGTLVPAIRLGLTNLRRLITALIVKQMQLIRQTVTSLLQRLTWTPCQGWSFLERLTSLKRAPTIRLLQHNKHSLIAIVRRRMRMRRLLATTRPLYLWLAAKLVFNKNYLNLVKNRGGRDNRPAFYYLLLFKDLPCIKRGKRSLEIKREKLVYIQTKYLANHCYGFNGDSLQQHAVWQ